MRAQCKDSPIGDMVFSRSFTHSHPLSHSYAYFHHIHIPLSPAAGWAAGLAATWAAGLAALLAEGVPQGLAALGAGLAGGSSPCGKHFASGASRVKYNFSLAKTFATNTPRQCLGCKKPKVYSKTPIIPPCLANTQEKLNIKPFE